MKQLGNTSRKGKKIQAISLAALLAVSFASMMPLFSDRQANAASTTCDNLTITGVRASSDDGNVPANTIDNNPSTRWSGNGIGSWIRADLGQQEMICSVDIAWYRGDTRVNNFVIAVSTDGASYTNVHTGKSSGATTSPEMYSIAETEARYVRITVNGNSDNDWASITEIDLRGSTSTVVSEDNSSCDNLTITGVRASSDDGNVPANTIDNNPSTRWSGNGIGSWIRADLGQQEMICSVDIAWYRGDTRVNNFVIAVSTDGSAFKNVYSDESSGDSLNPERYTFAETTARYIRITVNGNTQNTWASITEIDVNGDGIAPPTGGSDASNTGIDQFGIKELYPTKTGGDEWFMDMSNPNVNKARFDTRDSITKNSDGSWKVRDTQIRMNVYTKSGYDPEDIETYNQKALAQKGYMQDSNDWKNVEITGYVRLNDYDSMGYFSWFARSGWHTHGDGSNGENRECEGTGVKPRIYYNGNTAAVKEIWHNEGYAVTNRITDSTSSLEERWMGIKTIIYDVKMSDGSTAIKQELWVEEDNDKTSWRKVNEYLDRGGWNADSNRCGGTLDQKILWGGPVATFRWDHATNVDFKWLSIREIQAL